MSDLFDNQTTVVEEDENGTHIEIFSSVELGGANIRISSGLNQGGPFNPEFLSSKIILHERVPLILTSDKPIQDFVISFAKSSLSHTTYVDIDGDSSVTVIGRDTINLGRSPYSFLETSAIDDQWILVGNRFQQISIEEYSALENLPTGATGYDGSDTRKFLASQTLSFSPSIDNELRISTDAFRGEISIVGIGIVIPEPSSSTLILTCVGIIFSRRRRNP